MAELDKSKFVNLLCARIGSIFAQKVRKSYYAQLERLVELDEFKKLDYENQQIATDLLALAAFHSEVICPVKSSGAFVKIAERAKCTHVRVGRDKLDEKHYRRSLAATIDFETFLKKSRIPAGILMYSTLAEFLGNLDMHFKTQQTYERMD